MNLEELYNYKNELMKDLCSDENIVKLVTGNEDAEVPNRALAYSQIFPYQFLEDTVEYGQTYICFDVDIISVPNKTYYTPILYVWVLTHKSRFRLSNGKLLLDQLSAEINRLLNGSRYFGLGQLDLDSVERFRPITDFYGRVLTFCATDFNRGGAQFATPAKRR